jgi:hypothetical protein
MIFLGEMAGVIFRVTSVYKTSKDSDILSEKLL